MKSRKMFADWHERAVKDYGKKFDLGDFSSTVRFIITAVLNRAGYYESDYTFNKEKDENIVNFQPYETKKEAVGGDPKIYFFWDYL